MKAELKDCDLGVSLFEALEQVLRLLHPKRRHALEKWKDLVDSAGAMQTVLKVVDKDLACIRRQDPEVVTQANACGAELPNYVLLLGEGCTIVAACASTSYSWVRKNDRL